MQIIELAKGNLLV